MRIYYNAVKPVRYFKGGDEVLRGDHDAGEFIVLRRGRLEGS